MTNEKEANTLKEKAMSEPALKQQSYSAVIATPLPPQDVFALISDISKWWPNDYEIKGSSVNLNDEFTLTHGDVHYSKHKVIEVIPDKKIIWLITDSRLNAIEKGNNEWTNTKMVFEIELKGDKTVLNFTHLGLVPALKCY
jgi:hypothetical protein